MQKFYPDRIFKRLANLQLAIGLLLTIGIVIAIGSVIEQDQNVAFYQQNYPEEKPIWGFVTWKFLTLFNFDHIYTSYWFVLLLIFFSLSLISCTFSTQLPILRRLRRWLFFTNVERVAGIGNDLPTNMVNNLTYHLHASNYNFFRQGKKNYAYAGILGRFGPIIVHLSIILLLVGSTVGSFSGYMAQQIVPRGEFFHTQNLIKFGNLSSTSQDISWRVNDFWITYTEELKTNQFYSDLSLIDNFGNEIKRKTVFVNEPFVYKGLTLYQTDWDIIGLKFSRNGNKTNQVSLKKVTKLGQKFWFGSINSSSSTFSILVNDLRGNIYIFNRSGTLIKECNLGQTIYLEGGESFMFSEFLTSTGLQIKVDPGIRTVYFSFALLILSTYASFISYSQIWGVEKVNSINVAGNSNRAILAFQAEFRTLLNKSMP